MSNNTNGQAFCLFIKPGQKHPGQKRKEKIDCPRTGRIRADIKQLQGMPQSEEKAGGQGRLKKRILPPQITEKRPPVKKLLHHPGPNHDEEEQNRIFNNRRKGYPLANKTVDKNNIPV